MSTTTIPQIFVVLVAIVAFLGALAATAGTTHTNVANQLRTLIAEFHKLNWSNREERERVLNHLEVLQKQIYYFADRVKICKRIHMFSYAAVALVFLLVTLALFDSGLQVFLLAAGMCLFLFVITAMRIKELMIGEDTIQIAVDEVLNIKLDGPV